MIIEVSLKENLKNKKIIKISNNINFTELIKLLSNKFNTKIVSVGTNDGFEFDIDKISKITKITNSENGVIKLICSPNLIQFEKNTDTTQSSISLYAKSDIFTKVYALNSYVPFEAITQLNNLCNLPGTKYLIGMPDLHQGRFPVGSVVITEPDYIYPELVGPDIGCGMSLIKTSIQINKYNPKQLERIAGQINIGNFIFDHNYTEQTHREKFYSLNIVIGTDIINSPSIDMNWLSQYETNTQIDIPKISQLSQLIDNLSTKYLSSMGTIGLGNHFVELLTLDKIKSEELVSKYSIDSNYYYNIGIYKT